MNKIKLLIILGISISLMVPATALAINLTGGSGPDQLLGTDGKDTLDGRGGNDILIGLGDNDNLKGGSGDDELVGDDDISNCLLDPTPCVIGTPGKDRMDGQGGDDYLVADDGLFKKTTDECVKLPESVFEDSEACMNLATASIQVIDKQMKDMMDKLGQ